MRKITFLKLLTISLIIISCNKHKEPTDNVYIDKKEKSNVDNLLDDKRQKEIADTKFFIENEYKSIPDENGVVQNYTIERSDITKDLKFDSKEVKCSESNYHIYSYITTVKFKLLINGETYGEYDFPGYHLECYYNGSMNYGRDFTFFPELQDEEEKKKIITSWTGQNFGCGEETNNLLIKSSSQALYDCGMLVQ